MIVKVKEMDVHGQSSLGECNSKDGIVPHLAHMSLGYNLHIFV